MNTMSFDASSRTQMNEHLQNPNAGDPPMVIQILSVLGFGAFSIVAVAMAFNAFWGAGIVVTMLISWTWAGSRMFGGNRKGRPSQARQAYSDLAPSVLDKRSSGNASFDAYRRQTLEHLERESHEFDIFLERLREAKGESEFDKFMDDRAKVSQSSRTELDAELIGEIEKSKVVKH